MAKINKVVPKQEYKKPKYAPLKTVKRATNHLRTSWHVQARLFFEKSTLHGVRYIAESGRPFIEKFMWFVCVAVGAVATMIIIVSLWEKFQTNPTITGLDTDFHNWDVPFPAITVCLQDPSNDSTIEQYIQNEMSNVQDADEMKKFFKLLAQLSYDSLEEFTQYVASSDVKSNLPPDTDLKSLIFPLMKHCEDVFIECEFKAEEYDCCYGFFPIFSENGYCYSFNSKHYELKLPWDEYELPPFEMKYIKETDLKWSLKFKLAVEDESVKLPVFIHSADEMIGQSLKPQLVWDYKVDRVSFFVKQTYTTEDARQLSSKQRHCIFHNERKLDIDHIYTYSACTQQCRLKKVIKHCNCIPIFYPSVYERKSCTVVDYKCIYEHLDTIKDDQNCDCELGCLNTVYEVGKLNENSDLEENDPKELETEFVSWPMVRYKREVLFGWIDLLVSFGGIAGLFLGFSLLSGVEIIYYFTIRTCCMAYQEGEELEKLERKEKSKSLPDYDLSLKPYFISKPLPGHGVDEVLKYHNKRNQYKNNIITVHSKVPLTKKDFGMKPPFGIEFLN